MTDTLERDTTAALASVDGGGVIDPEEVVEEDQREASSYLAEMAQRLKSRGWTVEAEQAEGTPADAILDCAERMQADLIAMETHGRGGLARMVFGSEADRVLRHAPCPLLLVRMEEDGDE